MFLKITVTIFAGLTIITSGHALLFSTNDYISYSHFFMVGTLLTLGMFEIQQAKQPFIGYLCIATALYIIIF